MRYHYSWLLVWRNGNSVHHINEVKLCRARSVLGLVTTFSGPTIPVFIQVLRPTQPGHSRVGAMSTGDGFGHIWEETASLKVGIMALYKSVYKHKYKKEKDRKIEIERGLSTPMQHAAMTYSRSSNSVYQSAFYYSGINRLTETAYAYAVRST